MVSNGQRISFNAILEFLSIFWYLLPSNSSKTCLTVLEIFLTIPPDVTYIISKTEEDTLISRFRAFISL